MRAASLVPSLPASSYSFQRKTKYCSKVSRVGRGLSLAVWASSDLEAVLEPAVKSCPQELHMLTEQLLWVCTILRMTFSFATPKREFIYKINISFARFLLVRPARRNCWSFYVMV